MADRFTDTEAVLREFETAGKIRKTYEDVGMVGESAPGYFIQTLGCQQNEADSEKLGGLCELMGYRAVSDPAEAKLILVNTCAIREHAEIRALSIVGEYKHIKDRDNSVIIGVGGCMVSQKHRADKFKMSCPYVSFTFDTASVHTLPSLVEKALHKKGRSFIVGEEPLIAEGIPSARRTKHSAWLSVMYGCNNYCSYCIVPYVRGRERSRREEDIINEARTLIAEGAKEITLLGQNVNSYGRDLGDGSDFVSLLRKICALDGDFRVRFMTSHPKDASDELIEAVACEDKMVKHFHLPVQSGSTEILRRMNRKYTAEHYVSIIDRIKAACPDITLTTDIIVGFPGESEDDFKATLDLVKYARYDMAFSFIYSPRIGTPAAEMEPVVEREISSRRMDELIALEGEISRERCGRFVGRTLRLLADEVSKNDPGMLTGRGQPARPVHFKGGEELIGRFIDVEITDAGPYSIEGVLK